MWCLIYNKTVEIFVFLRLYCRLIHSIKLQFLGNDFKLFHIGTFDRLFLYQFKMCLKKIQFIYEKENNDQEMMKFLFSPRKLNIKSKWSRYDTNRNNIECQKNYYVYKKKCSKKKTLFFLFSWNFKLRPLTEYQW